MFTIKPSSNSDRKWLLNYDTAFPLTFFDASEDTIINLVEILTNGQNKGPRAQSEPLVDIISESGIRCKEIEDYIAQFKPLYLRKLNDIKNSSAEWAAASDKRKRQLLRVFQQEAASSLEIQPSCNLKSKKGRFYIIDKNDLI
jgi:hypothetical protein